MTIIRCPGRLDILDEAFSYLANDVAQKFSPQTALAVAIRVEFLLAEQWEDEQEELRRRRDPNIWVEISIEAMEQIKRLLAATPPSLSNAAAEQHVIDLLSELRADFAWSTARELRKSIGPWLHVSEREVPKVGASSEWLK